MNFYIKEDRWEDFEENYKKYGFLKRDSYYIKHVGNGRDLFIYSFFKEIRDEKIDHTTYCGYAYEGEFRHHTKTYIGDLIADGYIETGRE